MNDKQQILLREMGYTLWQLRQSASGNVPKTSPVENTFSAPEPAHAVLPTSHPVSVREEGGKPVSHAPPQAEGGHTPGTSVKTPPAAMSPAVARVARIAQMDWDSLTQAVQDCQACELCKRRQQAVPGVGDRAADWLFIGEGPGAEEDARGEPFVGQAGKLLDAMLAAIGLKRGENVYIANAVKCRPEGNRTPHAEEIALCRPFLLRQIELLQPRLMVLLGKAAVHSVLGEDKSLASLRQKRFTHGEIPVVVTYHPAYLLRSLPEKGLPEKAKAWEDLCFARRTFLSARTPPM
ncbi:MAG: uracil-DNA glycosylase [Zoogloeaceae bacterium]|jgi:DNA polymerase|nr:uracil-DNA glycosylase [Zoogloeaceae bacterium]